MHFWCIFIAFSLGGQPKRSAWPLFQCFLWLPLGTILYTKFDEFLENFRRGEGGGSFSIQKILLQILLVSKRYILVVNFFIPSFPANLDKITSFRCHPIIPQSFRHYSIIPMPFHHSYVIPSFLCHSMPFLRHSISFLPHSMSFWHHSSRPLWPCHKVWRKVVHPKVRLGKVTGMMLGWLFPSFDGHSKSEWPRNEEMRLEWQGWKTLPSRSISLRMTRNDPF